MKETKLVFIEKKVFKKQVVSIRILSSGIKVKKLSIRYFDISENLSIEY